MTWWPPDQDGTLDPVERIQVKSDLRLFKAKETTTTFSVKVKLLKNSSLLKKNLHWTEKESYSTSLLAIYNAAIAKFSHLFTLNIRR